MSIRPSRQQRAVMEHPTTPLRVVAGAGTGKTTTMALRLAALIDGGEVAPEEALGITFTNKASDELSDRLRRSLPALAESGREVEVTTYHGFAHSILREFGPLVGVERDAGLVTPGYARQLLRDALGAAPRDSLDLTAPGRRVDELSLLAGRLGDHLRSTDDLRRHCGEDDLAAARLDMADALDEYAEHKRRLGVVDYADLIARAFLLVERYPEIAARIAGRYRVVLLDEYQDTNPAQRELLRRIFTAGFPVTAVGDPAQTIYEWRGASLENFDAFPDHFPTSAGTPAETLPLSTNRRSACRIVELANAVRSRIADADTLEPLRAVDGAGPGSVTVALLGDAVAEAHWIAGEIVRLHDDEGVPWGDIGVLFRKHRQMGLVRDALERALVPVEVAALGGLLEVPEVADLHAWLRILGRPDDAPALLRILLGATYRLGLGDLAPLAGWLRARTASGASPEELGGIGWAMLEAIEDLDGCEGLSGEAAARLGEFRELYRDLLRSAQSVSLVELCRQILDRTGAWPEVEALTESARLSARLNLYRFLDLAEEWSPLEGAPSLDAFLDYLDLLAEEHAGDELDTARVGTADAVALLTAHRAKGLEWPVVVLPALAADVFPSRARMYEDPDRYPHCLPEAMRLDAEWWEPLPADPKARSAELRRRHEDQEWRVAYVAVTRARERLIATCAHWYTERRSRGPGPLFDIIANTDGARRAVWTAEAGAGPESLRLDPDPPTEPDPVFPAGWRSAVRGAAADPSSPRARAAELGITAAYDAAVEQLRLTLDGLPDPDVEAAPEGEFRTSVTGLVAYATCPRQFYWSEVDRLPRRPSPARSRGVELHRRIELHNRGVVALDEAGGDRYDPTDVAPEDAGGGWSAFAESRFAATRPRLVEAPFELQLGDARVAGRIDAVYEPEDGLWEVVDFKSGRRRDDPAMTTQLEAYAVAAREAGLAPDPPKRVRVAFVFLGGGLDVAATDVDEEWLDGARRHLESLIDAVAAERFEPSPSEACRRCDFARFCDAGTAWLQERS